MKKQYWVDFECFCVEATDEHEAGKVAEACVKAGSTPAINSIEWTGDPASGDNLHPVVEGINEAGGCVKEGHMRVVLRAIATFFRGVKRGRKERSSSYNCSKCGKSGHNRVTCSVPQRYRCSVCRQPGHNSRTCPTSRENESKSRDRDLTDRYADALRAEKNRAKDEWKSSLDVLKKED